LSAISSVSPDASAFNASDDKIGLAPAVEEGPRKDANFLVAFDADSETAGGAASAEGTKVKGVVVPAVAPNPEKLPNFDVTAG
jgi:hypothetical protein